MLATRPLRVLMVAPRYLPYMGGVEVHTAQVSRRLAARGHDVCVATPVREGDLAPAGEERVEGVRIVRTPAHGPNHEYLVSPGLLRLIGDERWDVVHCQSYHTLTAPSAMLAARRAHHPVVVSFHSGGQSSPVRQRMQLVQARGLRPLMRRASARIAVSRTEAERFSDLLGLPLERFTVIPNGAELPVPPVGERPPVDPDLVVVPGRLERYKGQHLAIAALPALLRRRPGARMLILGRGPYEAELRALAAEHGVADRVSFDFVPPDERARLTDLLLRAGVVVFLSSYEAHPLGPIEAIGLGRPTLVAHASALVELVEAGQATSVALDAGPEATADAILAQLEHPLHPRLDAPPTWDACVDRLETVYEDVVVRGA